METQQDPQIDQETAQLRAELEQEIRNKRRCAYTSFECTQLSLENYKYCSRHILEDKNAPFKQCTYVYAFNGKRCHLPAPKSGGLKEYNYCSEHALKAALERSKRGSKGPPVDTPEATLADLTHYVNKSGNVEGELAQDDGVVTCSNDPFTDINPTAVALKRCNAILETASDTESEVEAFALTNVWHDFQADESDDESIDSDQEDPLKHANVFTAEEITLLAREKLCRLQALYIDQYRHLQYLLREKRRKYLHALKREKETCCTIHSQIRDNPKEQKLYKKLKALNNYQRDKGVNAILSFRLRELQSKVNDVLPQKTNSNIKCIYTEGGVKCGERIMPMAKYCPKHILEDTQQVLFKPCGVTKGNLECSTPVPMIFDDKATCLLHSEMSPIKSYNLARKDSDDDESPKKKFEEEVPPTNVTTTFCDVVKNEFIHYIPPEIPKMEQVPTLLFEESKESEKSFQEENCSLDDDLNVTDNVEERMDVEEKIDIKSSDLN